jgi:hypothetical protein
MANHQTLQMYYLHPNWFIDTLFHKTNHGQINIWIFVNSHKTQSWKSKEENNPIYNDKPRTSSLFVASHMQNHGIKDTKKNSIKKKNLHNIISFNHKENMKPVSFNVFTWMVESMRGRLHN